MIVSTSLLKTAIEKYEASKKMRENYSVIQSFSSGSGAAFNTFSLVVALIFFALELVLLFYAIGMALNCTTPGPERIVNIVLAVMFTLPYTLLNILFNQCAVNSLRNRV